jgi:DNA-binding MarR family transcriptional regulator
VSPDLRHEIRQRRPFQSLQQEAYLNLARTHAALEEALERVLAGHAVTQQQYNVLRILRGAPPEGLARNEIRDRLLTRMPDVTRLLDRMEAAGLVTRERSAEDRRQTATRLTGKGRRVVEALDAPVAEEHRHRLAHLSKKQLRDLVGLLTLARTPP